jgi:hypothetical protein
LLSEIEPADYGFVEDPEHDLEALGVDFVEPQLDNEYRREQPSGAADLDAALAYLRRGGALCKVPDAPGSRYFRLLVVGEQVSTADFKIEALTKTGRISWHPYPSYAAAEADLPRVKRQARMLGIIRGSWEIAPLHTTSDAPATASTLELAKALEGRRLQLGPWTARMLVDAYPSGEVAIDFIDVADDEPIAMLTVNSDGRVALGPGEILVNTWDAFDQVMGPALASGYFKDTGRRVPLGYAEAAVWRVLPTASQRPQGRESKKNPRPAQESRSTPSAHRLTARQRKILAKAFVDYQATNADRFARNVTLHLGARVRPHQPPLSAEEAAAIGARFLAKVETEDDRAAAVLLFALPFALPETMTDRQTEALLAALAPGADLSKLPSTNRAIRELGQVVERIRRRPAEPLPARRTRRGRSR